MGSDQDLPHLWDQLLISAISANVQGAVVLTSELALSPKSGLNVSKLDVDVEDDPIEDASSATAGNASATALSNPNQDPILSLVLKSFERLSCLSFSFPSLNMASFLLKKCWLLTLLAELPYAQTYGTCMCLM